LDSVGIGVFNDHEEKLKGAEMKKVILLLIILSSLLPAQNIKNVVFYYATSNAGDLGGIKCPPESLSLAKVTHIVHFDNGNTSSTAPYFTYMLSDSLTSTALGSRNELFYALNSNPGNGDTTAFAHRWQKRLIATAHANNVKVLLTIQAVDDANLNYVAADSGRTEVMTSAVCWFAKRFGYDGLELDWEGWITPFPDATVMNRYVRMLRRKMNIVWGTNPRPSLMLSCGSTQSSVYWTSQDTCVDAYVMQMYDFDQNYGGSSVGGNVVWHISPLYKGAAPSGSEVRGWNTTGAGTWKVAGHNVATLSALIPSYGTLYRGSSTIHTTYSSSSTSYSQASCLEMTKYGGTYRRDLERGMVPYINGTATSAVNGLSVGQQFWMTFEDSISVYYKMRWLDSVGCSTVGFYDITGAMNQNATSKADRFPVLNWVRAALTPSTSPVLNITASTLSFGNVIVNTTSAEYTYTLSGANLSPAAGTITITAPSGFQVSKTSSSGFASSLTCAYTGSALSSTVIFVRFAPTTVQAYSGNITIAGGGAAQTLPLSGSGVLMAGTFSANPQTLPSCGGTVTLSWSSQNATTASIDQGIGSVSLNSSKTITVTPTKTFTLTLSNGTASILCTINVAIDNTLPVQLTSFTGTAKEHKVELNWKTATEVNSHKFEIERRIIIQWEKIGEVPAAGTSNTLHEYTYIDNLPNVGLGNILYRLKTINNDGSFQYGAEAEVMPLPIAFSLEQNYPNPFNPSTIIGYQLSVVGKVRLSVYDMLGREVATLVDGEQEAGYYSKKLDGSNLSSGTYFARLIVNTINGKQMVQVRKILLAK
jgi:hypothetical protein